MLPKIGLKLLYLRKIYNNEEFTGTDRKGLGG